MLLLLDLEIQFWFDLMQLISNYYLLLWADQSLRSIMQKI